MKKRIFALMLALCLVLAMMPVPAFAEGEVTEPSTETVIPEETKKSEEPVVPEETKKSEEPVVPEETKKSEDPVVPEETKKSEDPVIPEETKKSEEPVVPEEGKKNEDPVIPEETKKPEEPTAAQKVQTLIDALPETVTAENRAEVEAQLTAIDETKEPLDDEERAALDFGKYNAAVAAINALDGMPGAEVPKTMEAKPLSVTMADWNVSAEPSKPTITGLPETPYNYKVSYSKKDGTALTGVPTGLGEYKITVTCEDLENNTYSGSADFSVFLSVSFDPNGGTLQENEYTIQTTTGKLSTLPVSVWPGHTFLGWFTDQAEGFQVDTETIYSKNTTLYARWKTHTYTISFEANGGEGKMDPLSMPYGRTDKLTANGFTWDGYRFTGWNTQADGTGLLFDDEETVSNLTSTDGGTVDLYAQWVKVIDRVDLTLSGHGLDEKVEDVKVTTKDDISFPLDNYDDGWGIIRDQNKLTSLSGQLFQADTQYYLWVTFSAKEGCVLEGLNKKNVFLDGRAAQVVADAQGTVTAVFRLPVIYTIETSAGKNGTISPEGMVAVFEGQDMEIKITPNKGYVVYRLTVDGTNVKTARTYTFKNIQESHTIHARFLKNGDNAKTGDSFPMATALGAVTISAAALAAALLISKKRRAR